MRVYPKVKTFFTMARTQQTLYSLATKLNFIKIEHNREIKPLRLLQEDAMVC